MNDDALRKAYARAIATRSPAQRSSCPAPETILGLVQRAGDEAERLAVLDHVMGCAACGREFELLRSIERASAEQARVVGHITWRRWAPLAAAAAIVLVVALGPARRLLLPQVETPRGAATSTNELLIAPVADATAIPGATVAFTWHSAPSAERYTLELLTSGGAVAVTRATTDTTVTVTLPGSLVEGDYRWWVTVTAGNGSATRSDTRGLRLRAR